jgi:hypothetical protein
MQFIHSWHRSNNGLGKVYGFIIEFGQQFVPPYAKMRRIMAEVRRV